MTVKQVIVIRRDLKMRRGKEIAQGAHASAMWLIERLKSATDFLFENGHYEGPRMSNAEWSWIQGEYRKVVCQVESEKELLDLRDMAVAAGIEAHLVTDLGATEFHGVPTVTALAIGPDYADQIDLITKYLKLY